MNEILYSFIKINGGDIKNSLIHFLNKDIIKCYDNLKSNELYLNDQIICIHKSTLEIKAIGKIVNISENNICICKRGNNSCIYLKPLQYYILIKPLKNKNNDRMFYENLLKII
tara:strand:+ start:346 stop:684 length:339 start_codon:yes stop_codon:yes gene_type:complete